MAKDSTTKPVVYITKDKERAEGMPESESYSIVSGDGSLDTFELLSKPETQEMIDEKKAAILVFKNNVQIEELARSKGWKLLNPSAKLAEQVENKITQVAWLGDLAELLPPHEVAPLKNITWKTLKEYSCVVQWAHGHTGGGTLHLTKESDLRALKEKFPDRDARVTDYIEGPMFTANIVVSDKVLVGNISYQITGLPPFTDNPFSTIGNDWSVPHTILTEAQLDEFKTIAQKVGTKLQLSGWKGLFGIDVIHDVLKNKLFLIEINARQSASTTFESQLQMSAREKGVSGITTFEAHIAALTDTPITEPLVEINDGAQILQRVTKNKKTADDPTALENAGYKVLSYKNTKENADLMRIQSTKGIMETHNKFNERGKEILGLLK